MKGGTRYLGIVTISMLLVVGIAMYIFGGLQILLGNSGVIWVAGPVVAFMLVTVGLLISVRRQRCSVLARWHERLISDRVNRISRILYRLLFRLLCRSCPFTSLCLGG
jgi:hypothetical protein